MNRVVSSRLRPIAWGLAAVGTGVVIWYIAHIPILRAAGRWLDVGEQPQQSDYVLVLNGDADSRPFVAAALANAGLAGKVLIPRNTDTPESPWPAAHQVAHDILRRRGVAPDRLAIIGDPCESTFDEARALAVYLTKEPAAHVTIVTNDYHSRRTRWVFRRVMPARADGLHFVAAPTDRFSADNWWLVEDGFVIYGAEYLKLVAYWLWYGNGLLWCGAMAFGAAAIGGRRFVAGIFFRRQARVPRAPLTVNESRLARSSRGQHTS